MSKYKNKQVVLGCVTGIEKYGIFVSLDEYYSGLIHISEVSNFFVQNLNDYVQVGETIRVRILEVDDENFQVKLSIKNLDYRITKRGKTKIKETESGFTTLKNNLDRWILEKEKEILENFRKN